MRKLGVQSARRDLRSTALLTARLAIAVPGLLIGLLVRPASAQGRGADCERLLGAARVGDREAISSRDLQNCGPDGIAALADLVRRAGAQSDTGYLLDLRLATLERSARPIFDAAAALVADRGASLPSRVAGLQILVQQVYGPDASLSGNFAENADYCKLITRSERIGGGANLLLDVGKRLADDRGEAMPLRRGGLCIVRHSRPGYALAEDVSKIHVSVKCESFYRLTNDLDHPIVVRFEVPETAVHGNLTVPAHGAVLHDLERRGTARFFSADELIAAVPNSETRCGS